jgi:hypothetical protein
LKSIDSVTYAQVDLAVSLFGLEESGDATRVHLIRSLELLR